MDATRRRRLIPAVDRDLGAAANGLDNLGQE